MMSSDGTPPKYNRAVLEQVILGEALRLHPQALTVAELCQAIVADRADRREIETATQAINSLKGIGLLEEGDVIKPTSTALHASKLLID